METGQQTRLDATADTLTIVQMLWSIFGGTYSLTHLLTLDIWGLGNVHLGFGITIGWAKVMEWGGMKEFIYIFFIIIYYYNNI